jgi:hypothetical protein
VEIFDTWVLDVVNTGTSPNRGARVELVLDRDVSNNAQKPCYVNPNVGMNI